LTPPTPLLVGGQVPAKADSPQVWPTLKEGDRGPAVEALQRRLNAGLDPSPELGVDGDFGPATRAAVARFQRSRNLKPTGVVDAVLWNALGPLPDKEPDVPDPKVVNATKPEKRPADPLDGPPFVTAKAWVVAEGRTGAVLWGQNAETPLEMASTTKIMTAWVVLTLAQREPTVLDEIVTFSERADATTGSTSGLRAGEQLPVRELLFGLLLPSGNDAAVALAEHFGERLPPIEGSGSDDPLARFVEAMNQTAGELELRETHFANPHGLPAADHHSSARDLARLAARALANPILASCVSTSKRGCTVGDGQGGRRNVVWTNTNRLLAIEGYDGVKTGTTSAAGACLIASGRRGDDHLLVVVLGSGSSDGRYADARNLFRWAWIHLGHGPQGAR
jgi:D-alanyl-D-alanine carboxypeptidase (penicillin-binding protein 5/6)